MTIPIAEHGADHQHASAEQGASAPLIKHGDAIDRMLGEFHGSLFRLCEAARAAGDQGAEQMASYIHDQFCKIRRTLTGDDLSDEQTFAPYPKVLYEPATSRIEDHQPKARGE